ncbi:hypothetical protein L798_10768 [Zootermopsis nevadensis]|uniref:Uncharacterized protein n=1 Tax=Zootermopsis nevadensis TaxID=136037 RepID=A0A067R8B6_ZOONE|nr:hypothetical protein L798_10768 [Zootermopsis nevadensis]
MTGAIMSQEWTLVYLPVEISLVDDHGQIASHMRSQWSFVSSCGWNPVSSAQCVVAVGVWRLWYRGY